jgi:hypothetical protein
VQRPSLVESHPDLAREAHGWDPGTVSFGSVRMLEWLCPKGHIYTARPNNRSHGTGCPYCAGHRAWSGESDLATTHPELTRQVVVGDPNAVSAGSSQRLGWECSLGHRWFERVAERTGGYGCPYCSGQRVWPGFNDLTTTHPDVASEAEGWNPTLVSRGSNQKLLWRCPQGHCYESSPNKRTSGRGCPYCSGNRALAGFNDLATLHPEIAAEADGWDPHDVTSGSNQMLSWRCRVGHVYICSIKARTRRGQGCPQCGRRHVDASGRVTHVVSRVIRGVNDFASARPDLVGEAEGWNPTRVSSKDVKPRLWRCGRCLLRWEVAPERRVQGSPCPFCAGKRVVPGVTDLATLHPDLAAQALGWDPSTVLATSWRKVRWICALGHEWSAAIGDRVRGNECPTCKGRVVLAGFNDLATTHPELASQADGWDPTTVSKGHITKLSWVCARGHRWEQSPNNRARGVGCPACAPYGYSPTRPGWLYLLEHHELGLLQIGITNVPDTRMGQHGRRGWTMVEMVGPEAGEVAYLNEQRILRALSDRGVQLGPVHVAGRFSGYTESWIEQEFPMRSLAGLLAIVGSGVEQT